MSRQKRRWMLIAIMGLAFGLRAIGLDAQSLWRDEVDAIRFASRSLVDLVQTFSAPGQNGPLYYLLLRPWLEVAGQSEFALRFFSLFFGVLSVPLTYRLARRFFPNLPSLALVAAFLAATSPYLAWYGQEGKMYALVVFLVSLSMERYLTALEKGGWHRWVGYVVVTSVMFYVHLIAVLMVPVQVMAFLLQDRQTRVVRWKPWLASLAVLTLPYLPLLVWQLPMLLRPAETGFRFAPLHEMVISLLASDSLGVIPGDTWWFLLPFVMLLLASGLLWKEGRPYAVSLTVLAGWLVVPVVGLFLVSLSRPLYTARYLIFLMPAYLLLLAAGTAALSRRSRLVGALLLVAVLVSNSWSLWQQARTPIKADFRAATEYLAGQLAPRDLILFQIPYGRHSFDYYYPRYRWQPGFPLRGAQHQVFMPWVSGNDGEPYRWAEGLYTNAGMEPDVVDRLMTEMTGGSPVVWLVATEVPLWDERGLVQTWLNERGTLTDEAQFVRVKVYRYELAE